MGPQYAEVMWVRHENDQGFWWPGVFVSSCDESSLLTEVLREDHFSSIAKFGAGRPTGKVPRFFLPSSRTLVKATAFAPYEKPPCAEDGMKQFEDGAKTHMDSILTLRRTVRQDPSTEAAPVTPLTAAREDKRPTEKHAIFPTLASSSAWSASSLGNTSQESPVSSTSDADTEFDIPATQLEPAVCQTEPSDTVAGIKNAAVRQDPSTEAAPVTPLTAAREDKRPTEKHAIFPTLASSLGNTSQESPVSSTSDADTEFDIPATQLEPTVCQTEPSDTVAGIKNVFTATMDVKRVEGTGSTRKTSALLTVEDSPEQTTSKRRRALTSTVRSPGHCYEERGLSLPRSGQIDPQMHGDGVRHSGNLSCTLRRKKCFKNSQIPIPGSPSTQGSGPPPRHQEKGTIRGHSEASIEASVRFAGPEKARMRNQALPDSYLSQGADKTETPQLPNKQEYDGPMFNARAVGMEVCEDAIPPTKNTEDGTAESGHDTGLLPAYEALQSAVEALQPSNAPAVLKQRTAEYEKVLQFVQDSVSRSCGGSLYLCGCPGTGKTQTMAHVQEKIECTAARGKFSKPEFRVLRGTALTERGSLHSGLWHAIAGDVKEPVDIEKALSRKLIRPKKSTKRSWMIVVVVDEIDELMYHNHDVLRKLFEWADAPKSRLVLVGIANSMEFDVGFSDLKNTPAKILFPAYSPANLVDILTERVGGAVAKGAIELCSRKVAATHGDARRAINVCREAVVLATRELQDKLDGERAQLDLAREVPLVTIRHMSTALACTRVSRYKDAIAALSVQAQIILCVAAALVASGTDHQEGQGIGIKSGKCERLTQGDLQDKCARVWGRLRNGEGPSQVDFSGTIDMLAAQGLMQFKGKQPTHGRARQLVLPIEMSDVEAALSSQPFFKTATGF